MCPTKIHIKTNANKNAMMKNWKKKKKKNQYKKEEKEVYIKEVRFDYLAWSKQSDSMTNLFILRHLNRTITEDIQQQQQQQKDKRSCNQTSNLGQFQIRFQLGMIFFSFCTYSHKLWFSFMHAPCKLLSYQGVHSTNHDGKKHTHKKKKKKKRVDVSHTSKSHSQTQQLELDC